MEMIKVVKQIDSFQYGVNLYEMIGHNTQSIDFNDFMEKESSRWGIQLFNKGVMSSRVGDEKKAISYYKEAIKDHEDTHNYRNIDAKYIFFNMANCLMRLNEFEEALTYYKKSIEYTETKKEQHRVNWNMHIATRNIVEREKRMNMMRFPYLLNTEELLLASTEKIVRDRTDIEAWLNRGLALLALSRWEVAIETFNQVLLLDKYCYEAWYLRDYAYIKNKELIKNEFNKKFDSLS